MKKYDWSIEKVRSAVEVSNCWFECLDHLGVPKAGYNYRTLKGKVGEYGIDASHFNYHYAKTHNGKHLVRRNQNRTDEEIFSYGSRIRVSNLKTEYIRRVLNGEERCEACGIKDWNGQRLTFQLHHQDGDHRNHDKNNLRLLCPNCHSQTENFSNRKRKKDDPKIIH